MHKLSHCQARCEQNVQNCVEFCNSELRRWYGGGGKPAAAGISFLKIRPTKTTQANKFLKVNNRTIGDFLLDHAFLQGIMTFKFAAFLSILSLCASSAAFSQEQHKDTVTPANAAAWQKQCNDMASSDKLDERLRPTFMIECVAGARLDTSLELRARDSK
jgi:hypothetical protein